MTHKSRTWGDQCLYGLHWFIKEKKCLKDLHGFCRPQKCLKAYRGSVGKKMPKRQRLAWVVRTNHVSKDLHGLTREKRCFQRHTWVDQTLDATFTHTA